MSLEQNGPDMGHMDQAAIHSRKRAQKKIRSEEGKKNEEYFAGFDERHERGELKNEYSKSIDIVRAEVLRGIAKEMEQIAKWIDNDELGSKKAAPQRLYIGNDIEVVLEKDSAGDEIVLTCSVPVEKIQDFLYEDSSFKDIINKQATVGYKADDLNDRKWAHVNMGERGRVDIKVTNKASEG